MIFIQDNSNEIINIIKNVIIKKVQNYELEPGNMPFHLRLLGKDRIALFSFIHSLNTVFGSSIFEPLAEKIASWNFPVTKRQYDVGNEIN